MASKPDLKPREAPKGLDLRRQAVRPARRPRHPDDDFSQGLPPALPVVPQSRKHLPAAELLTRSSRCTRCYACVAGLPAARPSARARTAARSSVDRSKCDLCGKCVEACAYEALAIVGREATVGDARRRGRARPPVLRAVRRRSDPLRRRAAGPARIRGGPPRGAAGPAASTPSSTRRARRPGPSSTASPRKRTSSSTTSSSWTTPRHKEFIGASNRLILENLCRPGRPGQAHPRPHPPGRRGQ